MAQERLGLFDTPAGRQEIRLSLAIVGLLFAALLSRVPVARHSIGRDQGFRPFDRCCNAFQRTHHRHPPLRSGHRFSIQSLDRFGLGLRLFRHHSRSACADVSRCFCHKRLAWRRDQHNSVARGLSAVGVSTAVIFYALLKSADSAPRTTSNWPAVRVIEWLMGAIILAALAALLTTLGHDLLPPIFHNHRDTVPPAWSL